MRSAVWRFGSCCRSQPLLQHLSSRHRSSARAASQQLHATAAPGQQLAASWYVVCLRCADGLQQLQPARLSSLADLDCCWCPCSLYVVDMLPLVYKYLPREQQPTGSRPAPAAASLPGQGSVKQADDPAQQFLATLLNLTKRNVQPPTHMALVVDVPGATYRCVEVTHQHGQQGTRQCTAYQGPGPATGCSHGAARKIGAGQSAQVALQTVHMPCCQSRSQLPQL